MSTKKDIFVSRIIPLLDQITAICDEEKIGMLMTFAMEDDDGSIDTNHSVILGGDYPTTQPMHMANLLITGKAHGIFGQMAINLFPNCGKPGTTH